MSSATGGAAASITVSIARVALGKPSHSVRPGSLTWTWVSTSPGEQHLVIGEVNGRGVVAGGEVTDCYLDNLAVGHGHGSGNDSLGA